MSEYDTSNQRGQHTLFFVLICFCLLFIASYASRVIEKGRVQQEVTLWEERIVEAKRQQAALVQERAYIESEGYIAEVARDELNLTKAGDKVIVVLPNSAPAAVETESIQPIVQTELAADYASAEMPIWRQWLSLFMQEE